MLSRRRLLPVVAIVFPLHGARAQAGPPPRWAAAVDSLMRLEMANAKVPGAQVAIAQAGRVVYTRGYGVADVESGRPVAERTLFQVGSVTKLVTATLLAQLASTGAVDLHAPVSRYVPELAGRRAAGVTPHHLLTHSSGWSTDGRPFGRLDDAALDDVFRAVTDTIVMTDPGRVASYSNPGFSMAGYAAERATGRRYADLVDSVVLRPLGMPRATFRPTVAMTYDFSQGHVGPLAEPARVQRPMPGNAADWPAGFLYATAAELSRLAVALMDEGMLDGARVLAAGAVRDLTTGHVTIPGERTLRYGYGLTVDSVGGRRVWQKNGVVPGFDALLTMWPDERFAVIVLANRVTPVLRSATALVARAAAEIETPEPIVYRGERDPTVAERAQLVGAYRLGRATVVVSEADGALQVRVAGRTLPARLTRDGARLVVGAPSDSIAHPYVIVRDANGQVRFLFRDNARSFAKQP